MPNPEWFENLPDSVKLDIHLESIFMPYSRSKRDAFWPNGKRFAHYTSAEAALSIIGSKKLWMRNATCMSDYREIHHGFDILHRYFGNEERRNAFIAALDAVSPGVARDAISLFDQWGPDTRLETYITSVSEHRDEENLHGRLSMWRAFGGGSARVAIILALPPYTEAGNALNVMFGPVAYMSEPEFHAELDTARDNILKNVDFLRTVDRQRLVSYTYILLISAVASVKHRGFQEEAEWRAIYLPNRNHSPHIVPTTKVIQGVPQIIHQLPLDKRISPDIADLDFAKIFDRLIIGPSPYGWAIMRSFAVALKEAGVEDAEKRIVVSDIPIRS